MFITGTYIRMGFYDGLPICMKVDAVKDGESVKLGDAPINMYYSWIYPGCSTDLSRTFGWGYAMSQLKCGSWKVITKAEFEDLRYQYRDKKTDSIQRKTRHYHELCKSCKTPFTLQVL